MADKPKSPDPVRSPAWKDRPNDVRNYASRYAELTRFDNPLVHGLITGGLGLAGGYLAQPVVRWLYPEIRRGTFPWVAAGLTGLLGGGLSYLNRPKQASFSAPINPVLMHRSLQPMTQMGVVPFSSGIAMRAVTNAATRPGGMANVQSFTSAASQAMNAVKSYFDPRTRVGWALAGAGAAMATRALGLDDEAKRRLGMPVDEAVRKAGPAFGMMVRGLNMAGGR